jgi:sulfite reductase beta subunit-like hemoprotein
VPPLTARQPAQQRQRDGRSSTSAGCSKTWHRHRLPGLRAVTLSFKRVGFAPGDADADTLDALAELADQFSAGEARLTHEQNLLLPWVHESDLPALYEAARKLGLAQPNIGLLTDMIACPGGDFCSLANARSLPIAAAITERYQDLDEVHDLGPSTCTSAAASTAAATTTAATSASWASTRTARSGTRSRWAAPTARPCRGRPYPARWSAPRSPRPKCRT